MVDNHKLLHEKLHKFLEADTAFESNQILETISEEIEKLTEKVFLGLNQAKIDSCKWVNKNRN